MREYEKGKPIFEPDALRRALRQLSEQEVNDTLLAEAGLYAPVIERFRGGKAEHNKSSLMEILGETDERELRKQIRPLVDIGFLEETKGSYKIPSLYRDGLDVTQGKAFSDERETDDEDEE